MSNVLVLCWVNVAVDVGGPRPGRRPGSPRARAGPAHPLHRLPQAERSLQANRRPASHRALHGQTACHPFLGVVDSSSGCLYDQAACHPFLDVVDSSSGCLYDQAACRPFLDVVDSSSGCLYDQAACHLFLEIVDLFSGCLYSQAVCHPFLEVVDSSSVSACNPHLQAVD